MRLSNILIAILLLLYCHQSQAAERDFAITDFQNLGVAVSDSENLNVTATDSYLEIAMHCADRDPRVVTIPLRHQVHDQKVRISFARSELLPLMGKFETGESGEKILHTEEYNLLEYRKGPVYFSLNNGYHENLSIWLKCSYFTPGVTGVVRIDKIEIIPIGFTDDRDFVYILALLVLLLFLAPGFLICSAGMGRVGDTEKAKLLAMVTPASILTFLILSGVLYLNNSWSLGPMSTVLALSYGTVVLLCFCWLITRGQLDCLTANLRLIRYELLGVFLVMLAVAAIISKGLDLPLDTFTHHRIRYLTYGVFGAHDPMFQFVNGVAILHDEPFAKYYDSHKLFYDVQDRGIIAGMQYAVARGLGALFNTDIAYSYGYYTLFGCALNVLALLPVFALHTYFAADRPRPLLILFLMCASPFLVINFYLTWFKLAGSGLIVSGIVFLLLDKNGIRPWILAGIVWGLAASFHPSLALALPVVTIWLLLRCWRANGNRIIPVLLAFVALMSVFVVINIPWSMVKSTQFGDTNKLFREHFLGSEPYDQKGGMLGTVLNFGKRYTLDEQISTRLDRLQNSLRIENVESFVDSASEKTWLEFATAWNHIEGAYTVQAFIPLSFLLLLGYLVVWLLPATAWARPLIQHQRDFRWLCVTQVVTIFLIIAITFGKNKPDLTWNMPLCSLLVLLYLLVHANLNSGKLGSVLLVAYTLFAYVRLFGRYF